MFSKKQIRALLWPLIVEQVLTGIMGVADTFMVSNVGEAAISGVALVDSVNMLVTQFFAALAAGGTIICSQYIGQKNDLQANHAARQVMAMGLAFAGIFCAALDIWRRPILGLIFGSVEESVMDAADIYLLITAASYPFLALYTAGAALHRAAGNSRRPMLVAAGADILNVIGNAVLIFGFDMGVAGAALATLASRVMSAVVILWYQAKPGQVYSLGDIRTFRVDWPMLRRILRVGVPSAEENGMFQFVKLAVQSVVSTLGTTAIAAQAVVATLETCAVMPGQAVGIGLITIAGQCVGSGRPDEARKYIRRLTVISTWMMAVMLVVFSGSVPFITRLTALTEEGRVLVCRLTWFISVMRVILWPCAFTLPNGLRAAGDVSYTMWVCTVSMWLFRVALCWYLCLYTPVGLWGVWIGWTVDWIARAACFVTRFRGEQWLAHRVLE